MAQLISLPADAPGRVLGVVGVRSYAGFHGNLPTGGNDTRTLTRAAWMLRLNQKRQNRMSDARIALAPIAASSSMDDVARVAAALLVKPDE